MDSWWLSGYYIVDVMCRKFKHWEIRCDLLKMCDRMTLWHRCQIMHTFMSFIRYPKRKSILKESPGKKEKHYRNEMLSLAADANNWICFQTATKQWDQTINTVNRKHLGDECKNILNSTTCGWLTQSAVSEKSESRFSLLWVLASSRVCIIRSLSHWIFNAMKNNVIIGSSFYFIFCNTYEILCAVSLIIISLLCCYALPVDCR